MKIGFVGLGQMGSPMACNLIKAGYDVVGYDPQPVQIEGMHMASNPADCARARDIVITMLPNGDIVRDVAAQIYPAMNGGALHIDCSTIEVASTKAITAQAATAGLHCLDAPVSGGISGANAGSLTFMVGGDVNNVKRARVLFDIMGQKAVHCGDTGAGQAAKICNNMILGATMIATCEAFALADKIGLDRQKMFDVVSTSSGQSWSISTYCPAPNVGPQSPADNDFKAGFSATLMLKDLRLSQHAAQSYGLKTPMGALACDLYTYFAEDLEQGAKDFSAILHQFTQEE